MGRILAFVCVLALLPALCAAAAPAEDAPLPDGRSQYVMDVTLDTEASRYTETVTVTFMNDSDTPWPAVCFSDFVPAMQEHAGVEGCSSAVTAVTGADGEALDHTYSRDEGLLTVTLPQPLEPGRTDTVTVAYEADVPRVEGERFQAASFPDSDGITFRLCHFYPMLCVWRDGGFVHHPYVFAGEAFFTECADYALTLRLPEDFTVVASGAEALLSAGDGQAVWQVTGENMRDLVVTASTEFTEPCTGQVDGVTVRSWGTPDQAEQTEASLQITLDSVELYGRLFGEYPYDELDICMVSMPAEIGGIEHPGLVEISYGPLSMMLDIIVTHEVAHQWFYAVVGNDQYDEPFLDESFASFCETLYRQYVRGDSPEDIAVDIDYRQWLDEDEMYRIDRSYGDYFAGDGEYGNYYYYVSIYALGRDLLWDLRQVMGDEAFFAMLSSWYEQESFRVATIDGFLDHLAACTDDDPAVAALADKYLAR